MDVSGLRVDEASSNPNKLPLRKPAEDSDPPKKAASRKRTKTGCLTCRKRRIKCDEGKPICKNCIKSKRQCEGYNQRLTFKDPLGPPFHQHASFFTHPPLPYFQEPPPPDPLMHASMPLQIAYPRASSHHGPLPMIAPKPNPLGSARISPYQFAPYEVPLPTSPAEQLSISSPLFGGAHGLPTPPFLPSASSLSGPSSMHDFTSQEDFSEFSPPRSSRPSRPLRAAVLDDDDVEDDEDDGDGAADQRIPRPGLSHLSIPGREQSWISPPAAKMKPRESRDPRMPTVLETERQDYWHSDDEASMVESDDDSPPDDAVSFLGAGQVAISAIHLQNPAIRRGTEIRTFEGFAEENLLDTYIPTSSSSPLNDPQTAAVFWYFVNVTGPSLSLYERHPWDATPIIPGQPVPKSRQHNWTYTFPIMAFNHPALLQAILAMGSLQLAKLRGAPPTAAMKHYHLSLRRVARNYRTYDRRTHPATLATTLLLSFYEVWNSDHDKWARHLYGARAILDEIPFREMTRDILTLKRVRRQTLQELRSQPLYNGYLSPETEMPEADLDVDAELVSQLSGNAVDHGDYGHAYDGKPRSPIKQHTERDVENYEHLRDLYWWYCKMDVYQSLLGGARLFMDYSEWTQCVPRGPCGKKDVIYGTYDHLILLLGRLTDFASKDLPRKRRAAALDHPARKPGQQGNSPPTFPGLFPGAERRKSNMQSRFGVPCRTPPSAGSGGGGGAGSSSGGGGGGGGGAGVDAAEEDEDLEASTAAAMRDWNAIRHAFDVFRAHLGPDFDPMGPEQVLAGPTPFGPPLTYRTYTIAGIWMNYYMGLITLFRSHPSMPPASMVAAGMMAGETAHTANEIGRIAAGLHDDCTNVTAISTLVGSVFIESCMCLFVAGIQFQDTRQRDWTVRRLHDVARLTGWQSARQIAEGCESAWEKAAQLGRGEPYRRAPEVERAFPASIWRNPRRINRRIQELEMENNDDLIVLAPTERPYYAMGLLAVEQDLERIALT